MGYLHIDNLYKNQDVLLLKECYAMEKIHGTSAHIGWNKEGTVSGCQVYFFSGGEKHECFISLFDVEFLHKKFEELGLDKVIIYGEAYGGKQQGMRSTYGDKLKFIVFDVKVFDRWLSVPEAEEITKQFNLEFVDYVKCSTEIETLNNERNKFSIQAKRNGITGNKPREGIVIRPLIETQRSNGKRIIAKHKNDEFRETKEKRKVVDPTKLKVLKEALEITDEWVTEMRLNHVLDKFPNADITKTGYVIKEMIEDVKREAEKEVIWNKTVEKTISKKCAIMFKNRLKNKLNNLDA